MAFKKLLLFTIALLCSTSPTPLTALSPRQQYSLGAAASFAIAGGLLTRKKIRTDLQQLLRNPKRFFATKRDTASYAAALAVLAAGATGVGLSAGAFMHKDSTTTGTSTTTPRVPVTPALTDIQKATQERLTATLEEQNALVARATTEQDRTEPMRKLLADVAYTLETLALKSYNGARQIAPIHGLVGDKRDPHEVSIKITPKKTLQEGLADVEEKLAAAQARRETLGEPQATDLVALEQLIENIKRELPAHSAASGSTTKPPTAEEIKKLELSRAVEAATHAALVRSQEEAARDLEKRTLLAKITYVLKAIGSNASTYVAAKRTAIFQTLLGTEVTPNPKQVAIELAATVADALAKAKAQLAQTETVLPEKGQERKNYFQTLKALLEDLDSAKHMA